MNDYTKYRIMKIYITYSIKSPALIYITLKNNTSIYFLNTNTYSK